MADQDINAPKKRTFRKFTYLRSLGTLARQEWKDRSSYWREHLWQLRRGVPSPTEAHRLVTVRLFALRRQWKGANRDFDVWFNARWEQLRQDSKKRSREFWERMGRGSLRDSLTASFDTPAAMILGIGTGALMQGFPKIGIFMVLWGSFRVLRRYVVNCVDAQDAEKLFRWVPERFSQRRREVFAQLTREVRTFRALRAGDMSHVNLQWDPQRKKVLDPELDYTPESLFSDAMKSVAAHDRVRQLLGQDVRAVAEPDKVVYRIHEGIAEVFLGWQIAGSSGAAEVQVKATACIVDFIYIFPRAGGRYALRPPGFVIRPSGSWSMDCSELPRDMKQPFGAEGDGERLFRNRQGIFEYDWTVRDFKHGYENHPRRHRKPWW